MHLFPQKPSASLWRRSSTGARLNSGRDPVQHRTRADNSQPICLKGRGCSYQRAPGGKPWSHTPTGICRGLTPAASSALGRSDGSSRAGASQQGSGDQGLEGGADAQLEGPQEVWAAAWQALEPPTTSISTGQQKLKQGVRGQQRDLLGEGKAVDKPLLSLQGLEGVAKAQLLALSLLALEMQVASLPPEFVREGSAAEWALLLPAVLASASMRAAQGWLGYCPPAVRLEAVQLLDALDAGKVAGVGGFSLATLDTHSELGSIAGQDQQAAAVGNQEVESKPPINPSLWNDALERVTLHALVLKHLIGGVAQDADPSESNSGAERSGSGRFASTSALLRDAEDAKRAPNAQRRAADQPRGSAWAWPFRSAGKPRDHGGQQPVSRQPGTRRHGSRLVRPTQEAGGPGGAATRAAALEMLQRGTSGVRGWGPRGSSGGAARASEAIRNAPAVLQDLAVVVADAVATAYLSEAGSGLSGGPAKMSSAQVQEGAWPTFLHPRLCNTRSLESFRNQVAFQRFLERNWRAVVTIYEDQHLLWGFTLGGRIVRRPVSMRRAKELQSLQGWRAAVSLLLEALDFATPILQKLGGKASEAVSWLLSALIGRSLGLIFRGIRQSLGMRRRGARSRKPPRGEGDETDIAYGYT